MTPGPISRPTATRTRDDGDADYRSGDDDQDEDRAGHGDVAVDLDADIDALAIADDEGEAEPAVGAQLRPRRFDHKVAARLGAVAAAGVIAAVVGAVVLYGGGQTSEAAPAPRSVTDPAAAAAPGGAPAPTPEDSPGGDRPLTFTASADCPPGSTSAQTLAGADPMNAFVCVRDGVDGQVINIDLGKTYVVSAISITPGWIGQDSSGMSQWTQHRVVTRVQYMLLNGDEVTMVTQDTGNVHGEAVQPVKRVLASKIRMLILQTSRPPAEAPSTSPAPGGCSTRCSARDLQSPQPVDRPCRCWGSVVARGQRSG